MFNLNLVQLVMFKVDDTKNDQRVRECKMHQKA